MLITLLDSIGPLISTPLAFSDRLKASPVALEQQSYAFCTRDTEKKREVVFDYRALNIARSFSLGRNAIRNWGTFENSISFRDISENTHIIIRVRMLVCYFTL